ncbi:hypothetical protein [Agromyces sp. Leaf222]|uniref:hypothetical protein n=1 Tax=Agromyces sp. Leaf222 TaxID=1735688 RepID=UPI000700181E|nr:hypothetical protein [Agromyces sp. Leaf222]KQM81293.1 hypothetical protein ASE68_16030 [Agromyces sp. Leaf222]
MTDGDAEVPRGRFSARPRIEPEGSGSDLSERSERSRERLSDEVARLRSRFARATRDGRESFADTDSDAYDIGMLAVIHLADLVNLQLPDEIADTLPRLARDGLRATRNITARNAAHGDNARLWETVSSHAPALLDAIDAALQAASASSVPG